LHIFSKTTCAQLEAAADCLRLMLTG
jgi:hypothetical protein